MCGGSPEIALGAITVDGLAEAEGCRRRVFLSVGLEGVDEGVGGVVGFVEFIGLDVSGLLKGLASIDI